MKIGPLSVDPPVVLAPMAGVTNPPFRVLCRRAGPALYVSEMITARALVEGNAKTQKLVEFAPEEIVRSVQLYGVDPMTMAEAARILLGDHGVHHIDLNFGCPVAKVTRKGGGAALPLHHELLRRIVRVTVKAASLDNVPVTVKFRMGVDDGHLTYLQTGRIAAEEGAAAIALHARTAAQHYSGVADWEAVGALKAHVGDIPVLGNGDIWEAADALSLMAATGCDGVVVGRGCLGRPWLFRDLADAFAGRTVAAASGLGVVTAVMREHASLLCEWLGEEAGMRSFRKHGGWYLLGYPVGGDARRSVGLVATLAELDEQLGRLDPDLTLSGGHVIRPRGKSDGPRRVVLPDGWLDTRDDPTPPAGAELLVSGG